VNVSAVVRLPLEPADAWRLLTDWERQSRWMRDAASVRVVTERREGTGVQLAVRTRVLSVPLFTERLEVVAWEPPRRLVIAHRSFIRGVGVWRVDPVPGGSLFRWVEEISLPVPVAGWIALAVYRPVMRRLMRGAMRNLRRVAARYASEEPRPAT
jgi:Polyketide cyclase / dehydrase and lipid transport